MRVDVKQIGYLLMTHPFEHRKSEHATVAVGQLVYEFHNVLVGPDSLHGCRHDSRILYVIEGNDGLLFAMLQIGQRQVRRHLLHPGLGP